MDGDGDIAFSYSARSGNRGSGGDREATELFAQMCQNGSSTVDMDIGGQR